ncbi:Peptidoglycan/xylan/chitin deacetylase, PgdA/CDA1 family [Paenibacillus tianmuensis]|uniref:Peptidoglycan/xylan/chitin deacetylase, PgdA/CDA1 family n=1 Tax=Paenibacillus tianmuensis TaxID=624147 RepID=A0A1G4P6C2_9BACL|nr:polysaccharide deacetylase family protein [Paenibacillus tianmuensis]SCW27711.1 Peptidoglycan/xylan/chitin deacetylase, PgdA/CDA1 family [Paenibacillus tianmuensis]
MSKQWIAILAALLLLTSCGAKPDASPDASAKTEPPASQPVAGGEKTKTADGVKKQEQQAAKRYTMNPKTYDIVPIDPNGAPKKVVLLTFDDGPKDLEMNKALLDTLQKHKAKAIFFLNGYRVKQKPELVKLLASSGQTIGNHSWDHIDLKKETKEKVNQQIGDVQKAIKELTGKAPVFFRPPFGSGSDDVRAKAKEEGLLFMTWSNGSKDWEMTVKKNSPEQVISNVLNQLHPGSNILMHELPWTVEALDKLLTQLEEKGYGFVDPEEIEVTT